MADPRRAELLATLARSTAAAAAALGEQARAFAAPAVDVVGFMATVSGMSEMNDSGLSVAREALALDCNTDGDADEVIDSLHSECLTLEEEYDREEQRASLLRLIRWAIAAVEKIDAEGGA